MYNLCKVTNQSHFVCQIQLRPGSRPSPSPEHLPGTDAAPYSASRGPGLGAAALFRPLPPLPRLLYDRAFGA